MSVPTCRDIADRLVDYADGILSPGDVDDVTRHIEECDDCRGRVEALHRSLALARAVWEERYAELASVAPSDVVRGTARPTRYFSRRRVAIVAAALPLLIAVGLVAWRVWPRPGAAEKPATEVLQQELGTALARASVAAQLLCAADFLGAQAECQSLACDRYRYIAKSYPETDAGVQAHERLASLCERRTEQ